MFLNGSALAGVFCRFNMLIFTLSLSPSGIVFVDLLQNSGDTYKLRKEQLALTSDIKFIISSPIIEFEREANVYGNKIIGVVNIDTKDQRVYERYSQNKDQLEALKEKIISLSEFTSRLF